MVKKSIPEHPSPYLNDLIESIDHQYDPGECLIPAHNRGKVETNIAF